MSAAVHPLTDEPARPGNRPQLRAVTPATAVDLARAERAVAELLAALGHDPASEQLRGTPRRVAASYAELLTPPPAAPGTPHHPGRRLAPGPAGAQGRRGRAGGRAPVHDPPGVRAAGARTVTSALHGLLRNDPRSRQEFFALTGATT